MHFSKYAFVASLRNFVNPNAPTKYFSMSDNCADNSVCFVYLEASIVCGSGVVLGVVDTSVLSDLSAFFKDAKNGANVFCNPLDNFCVA